MGLSSSKSKTSQSGSQQGTTTSSGTTMPVTPPWLQDAATDYVGRIAAFGGIDPNRFVAPASPLQQLAWQNAGRLSDWQGQARTAAEMAQQAGGAGPNLAGPVAAAQAFSYGAPALGPANLATPFGYAAPRVGDMGLVSGRGYAAPTLGAAGGYAAARAGTPGGIGPIDIAATTPAQAASLLDNLAAYRNPYVQDVVDAALADFDAGAAQQQARLAASGARSGAFGGSRFGIAEAQLGADLARARGATSAGLRDQGFRAAAELAASDAGRRQEASLFNAGTEARRAAEQAGIDLQRGTFNADLAGRFALDQAGRDDAASRAAMDASNQFALARAGLEADAARHGADAANRAAEVNAAAQNQRTLAQAGLGADAARFLAGAQNEADARNAAARNQLALAQAELEAQARAADAAARQQASLFNSGLAADLARFNAGQSDAAQARALQAAGLLGGLANDYGAGTRADLATMASLGDQQRAIEQAYALAPLAQLQAIGQLSGMTPYEILVGRAVNGSESTSGSYAGTSTTKTTPSLFSQILEGANLLEPLLGAKSIGLPF